MKPKHTPGPWVIENGYDGEGQCIVSTDTEYGDCVCITKSLDQDFEGNEANARLIAAAPEMLEALETLSRQLVRLGTGVQAHLQDELKRAQAALSKARGES